MAKSSSYTGKRKTNLQSKLDTLYVNSQGSFSDSNNKESLYEATQVLGNTGYSNLSRVQKTGDILSNLELSNLEKSYVSQLFETHRTSLTDRLHNKPSQLTKSLMETLRTSDKISNQYNFEAQPTKENRKHMAVAAAMAAGVALTGLIDLTPVKATSGPDNEGKNQVRAVTQKQSSEVDNLQEAKSNVLDVRNRAYSQAGLSDSSKDAPTSIVAQQTLDSLRKAYGPKEGTLQERVERRRALDKDMSAFLEAVSPLQITTKKPDYSATRPLVTDSDLPQGFHKPEKMEEPVIATKADFKRVENNPNIEDELESADTPSKVLTVNPDGSVKYNDSSVTISEPYSAGETPVFIQPGETPKRVNEKPEVVKTKVPRVTDTRDSSTNDILSKSNGNPVFNFVDKYREYSVDEGSRTSKGSLDLAGESLNDVGRNAEKVIRSTGSLIKNTLGSAYSVLDLVDNVTLNTIPDSTGEKFNDSYSKENPVARPFHFLGRSLRATGSDVVNVVTGAKNLVETGKHTTQVATNIPRPITNKNKVSRGLHDWVGLTFSEWFTNIIQGEGFTNLSHPKRSLKEKGIGMPLELAGTIWSLNSALSGDSDGGLINKITGSESGGSSGILGGETGGSAGGP